MRKLAVAGLALVALGLLAGEGEARHRRGGCAPTCASGYAPAAPCAPMAVSYVDQVMTGYRPVMKTRPVDVVINQLVQKPVTEKYNYTEYVTVSTPTKRSVTYYRCVTKPVPYTFTVNVPVYTPTKTTQTFYACVPTPVVTNVPVCTTVPCQVVDPCTGCTYTVCQRVTTMQPVTRTVMQMVPQQRDVVVNVCSWKAEKRQGTHYVTETVPEVQHFNVNVLSCQAVPKVGTRTYYVCETVPTKTRVQQSYCEYEQYQYRVRVPVYTPVAACAPPVSVGPAGVVCD